MSFNIDAINILVVLVALLNTIYGLIVYSRNRKDKTNFFFFILTLMVSMWGLSMVAYRGFMELDFAVRSARILYLSAAAIPISFLYFVFIFPHEEFRFEWWQKYILPIPFLAIAFLSIFPNALIETVRFATGERVIVFNQLYHLLYGVYLVGYFGAGYLILFKRFAHATGLY